MRKKKKEESQNDDQIMENPDVEVQENEASGPEIDDKDQEIQELKDKYLRLFAEFDNYKKRTAKEKMDLLLTAAQDTMSALLPVLDDFDRAKKNADNEHSPEEFSEGVRMIYHKLFNVLHQKGLEQMDTDGEPFDPEIHEAITEIPAPTDNLKGKILDTVEHGYRLNSRIIRFAKVVVGK